MKNKMAINKISTDIDKLREMLKKNGDSEQQLLAADIKENVLVLQLWLMSLREQLVDVTKIINKNKEA